MFLDFLFGPSGGLTRSALNASSDRSKLSAFLPWVTYNPETKLYTNQDESQGFIWELNPLSFAGEKTLQATEGLFRAGFPEGTIMQMIMHADDYIDPFIEAHKATVQRNDEVLRKSTESFCDFLKAGTKGIQSMSGIPARNFRLFFALKFPAQDAKKMEGVNMGEIRTTVQELLRGAQLYPRDVAPPDLLDWLRRLFNDKPALDNRQYDQSFPIRKQVILDSVTERKSWSQLNIGKKIFRCITPRLYPLEVNQFQTCQLFGGVWGVQSDADQIRTPFLSCTTIIFSDLKNKLHTKCNLVLQQQGVGSFAPSLNKKKDEYLWATGEVEAGTRFVQVMSTLWVWGEDESTVTESLTRARRVWEAQGYLMQEDKGILLPLFIGSLPFGLYDIDSNIETLERDQITSPQAAANILPTQGDFAGGGAPVLVFLGRKGQLIGVDIFDKRANNYNMFCAATSGSGKSFVTNSIAYNYYKAGAIIRLIDIGGSYKKLTRMLGGKFIDFDEKSNICINPFGSIIDINEDISVITAVIMQMIFSSTDKPPEDIAETATTLIKNAIEWTYREEGTDGGIDHVYRYLYSYPDNVHDEEFTSNSASLEKTREIAHMLAYNLKSYTTGNIYGKWFNGKTNLDIAKDEFVTLELENLKGQKELFKVVTLQILNAVSQDLYLSDRSQRRLIIFDEAWQFMSGDSPMLSEVIEGGYRRSRKYGGSFSVITQGIEDLDLWGRAGKAISNSSAFKFYLQADNYDAIREQGLIEYDPFIMQMLKSVKSNKPRYSEIFMDTPFGIGVSRLVVDNYSYYCYTSDPVESSEIEKLIKDQGMTNHEAIQHMVKKYRS